MSEKKRRPKAARRTGAATRPARSAKARPRTRPARRGRVPGTPATATYVYAVVRAARSPVLAGAPAGLPHTGPLRALPLGEKLWLVVATAPLEHYSSAAIERSLQDLALVGACGVGHSEVVQHVLEHSREPAVLPAKMFTLFASDERAQEHMGAESERLERVFDRVAGAREFGVRVTFDALAARRAAAASSRPGPDGSGAGFLARKKAVRDERQELQRRARARVEALHEGLARHAREARRRPHSSAWGGAPHLLEGAYLVARRSEAAFLRAARQAQAELEATGCYGVFVIGPWPPYSFLEEPANA